LLLSRVFLARGLVLALVVIIAGHWVSGVVVAVIGCLLSWSLKVAAFRYR
jgi:hypothetical protein